MSKPEPTMARQIAEAAVAFEKERTDSPVPRSVTVVVGEGTVVITFHDALSPAEKALARSEAGAVQIQEYHRQIFDLSSSALRAEIERITGLKLRGAAAEVEPATGAVIRAFSTGNVVQVFQLGGSIAADIWSGIG